MNKAERAIVLKLGEVWNDMMALPVDHPMEQTEFCLGIHRLQNLIAARGAMRRLNKELAKKAKAAEPK